MVAAQLAADEGVRIYAIGIGADPQQSGAFGSFGFSALDLDETSLRAIADVTGGEYFRARNQAELEQIDEAMPAKLQLIRTQMALVLRMLPKVRAAANEAVRTLT